MTFIFFKILITSIIIVSITEIAKFNDKIGGLIAAMPLTTFLILFWMYYENMSENKISVHMSYTLLYLTATVPMFLIFPYCINKFGFWITIFISIFITLISVFIIHQISKNFDIKLF